jgi:thiol-disulfide isomerase/thioredoxin
MIRCFNFGRVVLAAILLSGSGLYRCAADEPDEPKEPFVVPEEVRDALSPLFKSILNADVSRVTVEMTAESLTGAQIMDSQTSIFQIGSIAPEKFTIYMKATDQRLRVYCNGKEMVVAMSPDAFFRAPEPIQTQQAATEIPVPLGPYPEAVLALSLAGVDPAITLLGGMKSVTLVDRGKFRGEMPAVHFKGLQDDGVSWDFWITQGESPRPLRLLVDLTPMLRATGQAQFPDSYSYQLRFDFSSWRMTGEVDEGLFTFSPSKDAVEYKSLDDYYESVTDAMVDHPLLGADAPVLEALSLDGKRVDPNKLAGRVVVLDFWATWCEPCVNSMPVLTDVCRQYADKGVVFFAVNIGETADQARAFSVEQKWTATILLDPDGKVADAFKVDAIPQTVIVGPAGTIQAVHVGFNGEDSLRKKLSQQFDTLIGGGQLVQQASK